MLFTVCNNSEYCNQPVGVSRNLLRFPETTQDTRMKPWLRIPFGNATAYWCAGSTLTLFWFIFKAPQTLKGKTLSAAFTVHLACSVTTASVCMWNLCFTPSQGPVIRTLHRGLGRLSVAASLVGLGFGYVAAWTDERVPRAGAIGLSAVGVLQLVLTLQGFNAIRSAAHAVTAAERSRLVTKHVESMNTLFYGACLGPAWFRVAAWGAEAAGFDASDLPWWFEFLGMIPAILLPGSAVRSLKRRSFF